MYGFQGFYSDSISNKSQTYAAEAFSKYILNNSHNDQRTSPPTTSKAESQAYSQTIQLPSHHFYISKSHGVQALGYTMRGRVSDGTTVMFYFFLLSSRLVRKVLRSSVEYVAVQFNLLFYMSLSGGCNEK